MKYIEREVKDKTAYVIPIGDLHIGDKAFKGEGERKLRGYLDWVKEHPNALIFLNGDIFNVGSRISATSPFEQDADEYLLAETLFEPYADRIIGATDGNHEARMMDMFGVSPTALLCAHLKIPYCKWSACVRLKVGLRNDVKTQNRYNQSYNLYFHHTTGGGGTLGSKMNRVVKLRDIIEGIDVYFGSHNHQLGAMPQDVCYPQQSGGVGKRRIWYVDCGSYLAWEDSYAEKMMLAPTKLGSPRVRFSGTTHDVHVSL